MRLSQVLLLMALASCQGPSPQRQAPPDLESRWKLYKAADPAWPRAREEWLQLGAKEREVLVVNLILDMRAGAGTAWLRPLAELEAVGPAVVPYALDALQASRSDAVTRDRCIELLARVADEAVLAAAYEDAAQDERLRASIVAAVGRRRSAEASDLLARVLVEDRSWQTRARAAAGLAVCDVAAESRAASALIAALADSDLFVAREAAEVIAAHRLLAAAQPLLVLAERAHRQRDERAFSAALEALRSVTGHPEIGNSIEDWRAFLSGR
ncbi:MAG: hypothetical protein AB1486_09590 [Planctomycetota bacterium]